MEKLLKAEVTAWLEPAPENRGEIHGFYEAKDSEGNLRIFLDGIYCSNPARKVFSEIKKPILLKITYEQIEEEKTTPTTPKGKKMQHRATSQSSGASKGKRE